MNSLARLRRFAPCVFAGAACVLFLSAASLRGATLEERLKPLIAAHEGQVAVAVKHLEKGEAFSHRADEPMPTASLIKFSVMIEAYRQADREQIDLAKAVVLRDEDKVPGSGILTSHFSAGAAFPLRDAVRLMIAFSDNTATNLVLDQIGLSATAKSMEELGCPNTKIHAKVFKRETSVFPERSKQFGLGSTTAAEMLRLLELLHQRKLVSPEASDKMREHLLACDDRKKFPRLLPEGTKLAHKTGSVDGIRTDAGIIETPAGPIALCVLTSENKDTRWADDNAGDLLCSRIALAVYEHFNPPAGPESSRSAGTAGRPEGNSSRAGGRGWSASKPLRVISREAVCASTSPLQKAQGLPPGADSGGPGFRDAHRGFPAVQPRPPAGGGVEEEEETSDTRPGAALEELKPRDALTGPPFVACRNWAVAEARTGKILWGSRAADVVDTASTTKIMTAYVILKLAEKQPEVLDEVVAFSERASKTAGSSCKVRAGEKLPVGELLYGLLVPSGNDAAIALAEHFGSRFEPPPRKKGETDPVARFVAEMNRAAAKLNLADTRYTNPNGLPEKGHASSAQDLARLTTAAGQLPHFRDYVSCRQHEARVAGRDGSRRSIVWKTTNRLLAIAGYTGVKTGYTKGAGSCLVSSGVRGRDSLVVVVLGAPSAAAAVADSRNLYRWAWRERGHKD
ncbi:MAG: serine hydrolase [Deltaproteobacteria bacterium]